MRISIFSAEISHRRCHVEDSDAASDRNSGTLRRVLIVGATGVLRPAVLSCVARGWTVVALARNEDRLDDLVAEVGGNVTTVAVDVYNAAAMAAVLASGSLRSDDAILYLAAGDDMRENAAADRLSIAVRGTVVRILNSRWAPAPPATTGRWPTAAGRRHLLLGVAEAHDDAAGRWHTPEEISVAALHVLVTRSDLVLGTAPSSS